MPASQFISKPRLKSDYSDLLEIILRRELGSVTDVFVSTAGVIITCIFSFQTEFSSISKAISL